MGSARGATPSWGQRGGHSDPGRELSETPSHPPPLEGLHRNKGTKASRCWCGHVARNVGKRACLQACAYLCTHLGEPTAKASLYPSIRPSLSLCEQAWG